MRTFSMSGFAAALAVAALRCGGESALAPVPTNASQPFAGGGSPPQDLDAGRGGSRVDGGGGVGDGGPADASSGGTGGHPDAGTSDAGSSDGGAPADDSNSSSCDGLVPAPPSPPFVYRWQHQDLAYGSCLAAETDGTGHVALQWQGAYQPHGSMFAFLDSRSGAVVGSFGGTRLDLIGQSSGFIGNECLGGDCFQDYVVLDPSGQELYRSPPQGTTNNWLANDPTGGMVEVRLTQNSAGTTVYLDAIDATGAIRWTRALPDVFTTTLPDYTPLGVDRRGNVLVLWPGDSRYGPQAWAGQWFDHVGAAGPVFRALTGDYPREFFPRVGGGLFLSGYRAWLGQFKSLSTSMSPPPEWLAMRPNTRLHMVHGGRGYAVLPPPGATPLCDQTVDVMAPSGKICGSSRFSIGGGSCTTSSIIVGYDGTVVQQLPREREGPCGLNDHDCDCTYRYWPGSFR